MSKGEKWFSEEDKEQLREKLCIECENFWKTTGYKKTAISKLTKAVGISVGAFYSLFSSKEELFLRTIMELQARIKRHIDSCIKDNPNKLGACNAIKYLFGEYQEHPFLYDFSSPDFWALIGKLPEEQWRQIQQNNLDYLQTIVKRTHLEFKVAPAKAHAILATLLYTVTLKNEQSYSRQEVFDFLLDCTFDRLFSQAE